MSNIIQFVGDPFVDTGVAVLECRVGKDYPEITIEDVAKQADELEAVYSRKAWMGYLTVHFPNSCWCNFTMGPETKQQLKNELLRSFGKSAIEGRHCVYCRRPAQHIADRSMIPLLTGAATMTCGAGGEPGLPVCSGCLYAIQFYPLAALKVNGKPMFWWTLHHDWMSWLTEDFLHRVEMVVEASPEQVTSQSWPSTRLLESAATVMKQVDRKGGELPLTDLVACHATNYGSGPEYDEYRVRRGLLEFLRVADRSPAFDEMVKAAWESEGSGAKKKAKNKDKEVDKKPDKGKRNILYEDLGSQLRGLAGGRDVFIERHFRPWAGKAPGVFSLACTYARKVLEMTQQQVEAIKKLSEQIAASKNAEGHLDRLFQRSGVTRYIQTLADISDRMKRGNEQPLAMDTVLQAFDLANEDDSTGRDAALVRELILIRLIELLPQDRLEKISELEPGNAGAEKEGS